MYLCSVIEMKTVMRIIVLVAVWLVSIGISAERDSHTIELQTEMLHLISTPEKDRFLKVTEQLKEDCRKRGDERLFYTTWAISRPMRPHTRTT